MGIAKSDLFLVAGHNIACALKSFSPTASTDEIDATVLCSTYRVFESGFKSGGLSAEGVFDSDATTLDEIHDVLSDAFDDGAARVVSAGIGFYAIGGPVLMLDGCDIKYAVSMPLGLLIMSNAEFRSQNGLGNGKWLISAQRNAGSFNSTSVDNTAATANGGLSHAHLFNDDATAVTILTQKSTNNSTWTDLSEAVFGTRSTGSYTFGVNPTAADTIVFNGVTFTFIAGVSTATDIQIKGTLALTLAEAAIVLSASVDTDVDDATYTATATKINVSSVEPGTAGNAYTLDTPTAGNVARSGATLSGGADIAADAHLSYSETIAKGTTIPRYLRTVTKVYGGNTILASAAFARRY